MQVEEVMSRNCRIVNANDTLQKAARIMREENVGILPVQDPDQDRLIGMITDRDIVTEHEQLRQAACDRDAERAQRLLREHILLTVRKLQP